MKYSLPIVAITILLAGAACTKKTDTSSSSDEWPELDAFHMVMAEAYHPYKDSANVEPAKKMAEELAAAAEKWQNSPLPEKVNNDEVKGQLESLKNGTRELADQVKAGAKDDEIGAKLTALHDSFHKLVEAWHGGGAGGEKH